MNAADGRKGGSRPTGDDTFSELYGRVRKKEQWAASDAELSMLPEVHRGHPHYREWAVREKSCRRLLIYLSGKREAMNLLEVGCGNGWLSGRMAEIASIHVTGIDVHREEVEQARRVFTGRQNLNFLEGDMRNEMLGKKRFNVIVFAASIQYFPDLKSTLRLALERLLTDDGEIHILDSPLYTLENIDLAAANTWAYYEKLGFPDMARHYFHHLLTDLESFRYKILYNPSRPYRRLFAAVNPFFWIRVKNN